MSTFLFISFIGIICFLFLFWKRLKEDYISSQIFTISFYLIVFSVLSALVAKLIVAKVPQINSSGIVFWACLFGLSLGYFVSYYRFRFKRLEVFESTVLAALFFLMIVFASDTFVNSSWFSFLMTIITVGHIVFFYFLDKKYKKFTWYKSGKIGFSGLTTLGFFFLTRSILALFFPFMLSFLGRIEGIVSSVVAFLLFFAVYNLSQKKV